MKHLLVLATAALACVSCSKKEKAYTDDVTEQMIVAPSLAYRMAPNEAAAPRPVMVAEPAAGDAPQANSGAEAQGVRIAAGPPMLAYSYSYGLSLPHRRVDSLRRRHEESCLKAGYRVCQVVSTSIRDNGDSAISGQLTMRATSGWLKAFREGLGGETKGVGGRIQTSDVTSEDLSREIVDTEAQLRAKQTLRDRLQALLANRPGRLADLLSVERELARVQGEIDSTQSQLTVMRARVAMSEIEIVYASKDVVGPAVTPLSRALGGFFGAMALSVAAMIDIVAVLAPWAVVAALVIWWLRKRLRSLLSRIARPRQPVAQPQPTAT